MPVYSLVLMSLLGSTPRSDTALNVYACAIAHVSSDGAAAAAFHVRLPGTEGSKLGTMLQQLIASARWQQDVLAKGRMTVDDTSSGVDVAVHCMVSAGGLIILGITRQDYPTRIVFPSSTSSLSGGGLLTRLAEVGDETLGSDGLLAGGRGAPGTVRKVQLTDRLSAALERACADFEDKGAHDSVARVQGEVDEAREVMHGALDAMLHNSDQLTALQGKSDAIAGKAKGFYGDARATRRQLQCEEFRNKCVCIAAGAFIFVFLFGGWIFGSDEEAHYRLHIPPSPPPPSLE